jgi:hypothetical protein
MESLQTARRSHASASSSLRVEVQIQQARQASWLYEWDRQKACLRVRGMQPAQLDLPADLATLRLEGERDVPVMVFTPMSLAPHTWLPVRILGALQALSPQDDEVNPFPLADWVLLAVPDLAASPATIASLEQLSSDRLVALHAYLRDHMTSFSSAPIAEIVQHAPEHVEQQLRAARVWLKRIQRQHPQRQRVSLSETEEKVVAWRAVEGITKEQRRLLAQVRTLEELAPYLQAEQLIRFVSARFQYALSHLLLDEERVLAFFQRPLLQHRTGWLGMKQWRSHEGLLLITDRHCFWLRDFLSPGSSVLPEGYIAHAVPLERLKGVYLLAAGPAPAPWAQKLESRTSAYQRLILEIESQAGSELMAVEFPSGADTEQALSRLMPMLHAFLPRSEGQQERRVRRLPQVEAWQPARAEAERLAGLGGMVPAESKQRLEQRLAEYCRNTREEVLVSALVPALESAHSPLRLVALTRQAVLLFDEVEERSRGWLRTSRKQHLLTQRYDLSQVSSVQISYSLLSASLRLFVPQQQGSTQQQIIPFQSPAIAWFLPLFTRLRLLLSAPYHRCAPR